MFMFYSALILVTLERFENITIGFLMVNNPYRPVFIPYHAHLMAFLNLVRKDDKNDGLTEGCAAVKTMFFPRVFSRSDVEFVNASHTVLLMDRVAVYRGHSGNSNLLKLSS